MSEPSELPAGYGQIIYDGYRNRARVQVGKDVLAARWGTLVPDDQACWDGAAADLANYLDRLDGVTK